MAKFLGKLTNVSMLRAGKPKGSVDAVALNRVVGWAFAPGGVEIEAWVDGACVAKTKPDIFRPDVAHALNNLPGTALSGFALDLPRPEQITTLQALQVVAKPLRGWVPSKVLANLTMADDALVKRVSQARDYGLPGPFPKSVIGVLTALWPEDIVDTISQDGQIRVLSRLLQALATSSLNSVPALSAYSRFLTSALAHCRFVERHFPVVNTAAKVGANDFHAKPNSVNEIFSIIHQLYVLKSWGVVGDFAEFGCFKGYSSAMLSFACAQLDIHMHVFDSFEGLPSAEGSGYEKGQYAGSLDEVRENIRQFGCIEAVEFHKGFFADSLRAYRPPALMCLWMDVDLEVSARDLMVVADCLDPRASLFSHECTPDIFRQGHIVASPNPDNPIPPMLARHEELGRPLTGHHVAGYTGAFWPVTDGTPVMNSEVLRTLMNAFH